MAKQELTKRFMEEHGKTKKGMKVSWNEYLKLYETRQKEIENKIKQQEKEKEQHKDGKNM